MKLPNSYGSVVKLSGKRRRPYAVRTSEIAEYIDIHAPQDVDFKDDLKKLKFSWRKSEQLWSAVSNEKTKKFADKHSGDYKTSVSFRQHFTFHAYFEKSTEAHKYLAEFNSGAVVKEEKRFADSPTFANIYKSWTDHKKGLKKQLSDSTWGRYKAAYNIMAPLHEKRIDSIKTYDVQEILNKNNTKSSGIIFTIRTILKGMYKFAKMNRYVNEDITEFLVYEWTESEVEKHKAFSKDEIDILWNSLGEIQDVDIVLVYIYTGMRASELLDIKPENVNLEQHYLVGGNKTKNGRGRIIPIADKIYPLVKEMVDKKDDYLIIGQRKKHLTWKSYTEHRFEPLMKKLGFSHLPHDTRHTFASLMDSAGANLICTKLIMGHTIKDITKGVYTHKTPEELLAEVNKI